MLLMLYRTLWNSVTVVFANQFALINVISGLLSRSNSFTKFDPDVVMLSSYAGHCQFVSDPQMFDIITRSDVRSFDKPFSMKLDFGEFVALCYLHGLPRVINSSVPDYLKLLHDHIIIAHLNSEIGEGEANVRLTIWCHLLYAGQDSAEAWLTHMLNTFILLCSTFPKRLMAKSPWFISALGVVFNRLCDLASQATPKSCPTDPTEVYKDFYTVNAEVSDHVWPFRLMDWIRRRTRSDQQWLVSILTRFVTLRDTFVIRETRLMKRQITMFISAFRSFPQDRFLLNHVFDGNLDKWLDLF
jgi:hypothetical protein